MAKFTKEQERKNYGGFVHENLFLDELSKVSGGGTGGGTGGSTTAVATINGKAPDASGAVTISAEDIKIIGGVISVETSLENKLDTASLGTVLVSLPAWTALVARVAALEAKAP